MTADSAAGVDERAKTRMTYFDTGWIESSDDPLLPRVHFDYDARGQQLRRIPEFTPEEKDAQQAIGELDPTGLDASEEMTWSYYQDGMLASRRDKDGNHVVYFYDPNNNLTRAKDSSGPSEGADPVEINVTYDGFDRLAKTRSRQLTDPNYRFSEYSYDDNSNLLVRRDDGKEDAATGVPVEAPRRSEFVYD